MLAAAPAAVAPLSLDAFTFSATEHTVEAGASFELPVPLTDPDGCFLVYSYVEKGGEVVPFRVKTDTGRTLLEESLSRSSGRLHVAQASRLALYSCWKNASRKRGFFIRQTESVLVSVYAWQV